MSGNTKISKSVAIKGAIAKASSKGVAVGKNAGKGAVSSTAQAAKIPTAKMKSGCMVKKGKC